MKKNEDILLPDKFYHIYSHANGNDNLFFSDDNYIYFLKKYADYISTIADTYAYCLMPNHFHFLICLKSENEIFNLMKSEGKLPLTGFESLSRVDTDSLYNKHISKQFSNLFNGYSQAINKQVGRKGSLFLRSFKRKEITSKEYLISSVQYIHTNPVHHGFCEKISDWKYSSYHSLISTKPTHLKRTEVVEWFDDNENFIYCHQHQNKTILEKIAAEFED